MKAWLRRICMGILSTAMMMTCLDVSIMTFAAGPLIEYELYPSVQEITYDNAQTALAPSVNVVVEDGIDTFTRAKIEQVLALQGYSVAEGNVTFSDHQAAGKTNVLIGIYGSDGVVDAYCNALSLNDAHMSNTDAYTLSVQDDVIAILGKDTDAAFYGITTLKEIFQQMEGKEIEKLTISDYADIKGRGFIEGYYGNPWSVEDRAELMRYGGDLKLNNYVYAPKDDPYHNSNWRALYDDEKLKDIEYLAKAGNESKCYYVYALHTFMHNAIRFDTDEHYNEDLNIIKAKFTQVMNVGVRQFALLADDAGVPGGNPGNYVRVMNDLTAWMQEKAKEVPGLKTNIIFCPSDYMGWGTSDEMQTLKQLPQSASIIQTGGKIWGEANANFIDSFYQAMGRPVYLWINWPCSDNTKDSLIMDGNEQFLQPNIDADKVDGIVLNPMQQSEANKSALFANADYTWNVWESNEEARANWEASFKYMDHQSALETQSSTALRELSRHMKNSNTGDHRESADLAPKLTAFLQKLNSDSYAQEADELIAEFTELKEYAAYYKEHPGNARIRDQIIYWLDCWEESMEAGINFLHAAKAIAAEESTDVIWDYFSAGQSALETSKTHSFHYVDHLEYATIGSKYIQPFLTKLEGELSAKITPMVNPNIQITTFITSRNDNPTLPNGKSVLETLTDGNTQSEAVWKTPNSTVAGDYIGIRYTKAVELNNITFYMGTNSNHSDTFGGAKIQYTTDGKTWVDIAASQVNSTAQIVQADNLNVKVLGIRLLATVDRENMWLGCRDIEINANRTTVITNRSDNPVVSGGADALSALTDGNLSTDATWQSPNSTQIGDYIGLLYAQEITLNKVAFKMGSANNLQDTFQAAKLQYTKDGTTWIDIEGSEVNSISAEVSAADLDLTVKGIRLIATAARENMWLACREIEVNKQGVSGTITLTGMDQYDAGTYPLSNVIDQNDDTFTWVKSDGLGVNADAAITLTFDEGAIMLGEVRFVQNQGDKISKGVLEYTSDGTTWQSLGSYTDQDVFVADVSAAPVSAVAVRVRNTERVEKWWKACELSVTTADELAHTMKYTVIKTPEWVEYTQGNQSEAHLHDGDDSTSAEYHQNGADTSLAGDYIGYDLGDVFNIGAVHIVVGGSRDAANKWRSYKLEYSTDNVVWTTYKEYNGVASGKDVIDENLKGIAARYIRITNLETINRWVHFAEFDVKEYVDDATDEYIITNTDAKLTARHADDLDSLNAPVSVALAQGEYIGFKFARIKDLAEIITDIDSTDLTLQISNNGIHWETVTDLSNPGIGRYVRLLNLSGSPITCNIQEFTVTSNEVEPISLHSSTIGIHSGWGDNRENGAAFDGDLNTVTKFAEIPNQGEYIIYDLGQERALWDIKLYNQDSDTDYIRDADVYVSNDLNDWGEAVMHIGDGVPNTNDFNVSALQSGIYQTSSRYPNKVYAQSEQFNKNGRYLKILMSAGHDSRAIQFNEIVLNDGEYVREINDPTFETDPIETAGFAPQHVLDGDLQSAFKPDTSKGQTFGSFLYRISENCDTKRINIMQSGAAISNAKVIARGYRKNETTISEAQIGVLDRTLNAIENYDFDYIFEIELQWDTVAPTIQEIILFQDYDIVDGDITALQNTYNQHVDKLSLDQYTASTKRAFDEAMDKANQVINMPIRTQFLIDDTLKRLNTAVAGLVDKASDIADFTALVEASEALREADYAGSGWKAFVEALSAAKKVYQDLDEQTQDDVDTAYDALSAAKAVLVSKQSIQEKQAYLDQIQQDYAAADYTKQTYDALAAIITAYEAALADEASITNEVLADIENEVAAAVAQLVDLRALKTALADAKDNYGESAYDPQAWSAYNEKLTQAEAVLKKADASVKELSDAVQLCKDAKALLQADALQALENMIEKAAKLQQDVDGEKQYSDTSYQHLQDALSDARDYVQGANITDDDSFAWIEALKDAQAALVDIHELGDLLKQVTDNKNAAWYTANSWDSFEQIVQAAQDAYDDPDVTGKTIQEQIDQLRNADAKLVDLRALRKAIDDAQALSDLSAYTPSSIEIFQEALKAAVALEQKADADAQAVEAAREALVNALILKADTGDAAAALREAESYFPYQESYTKESFAAMKDAYQALKQLDENAPQEAVDAATALLRKTIGELVKEVVVKDPQIDVEISATTVQLPDDVKLVVSVITDVQEAIKEQLPSNLAAVYPLDITLYANGKKIQPSGAVNVRIRIPDSMNKERLVVYHIGAKAEEVIFTIDGNYVVFSAESFSAYVLAEVAEAKPSNPNQNQGTTQPGGSNQDIVQPGVPNQNLNTIKPQGNMQSIKNDNSTTGVDTGDHTDTAAWLLTGALAGMLAYLMRRKAKQAL